MRVLEQFIRDNLSLEIIQEFEIVDKFGNKTIDINECTRFLSEIQPGPNPIVECSQKIEKERQRWQLSFERVKFMHFATAIDKLCDGNPIDDEAEKIFDLIEEWKTKSARFDELNTELMESLIPEILKWRDELDASTSSAVPETSSKGRNSRAIPKKSTCQKEATPSKKDETDHKEKEEASSEARVRNHKSEIRNLITSLF